MEMAEALAIIGKALGAGLCMGIGAIGPALGEGNAVSRALEGIYYSLSLKNCGRYIL